MAGTCSADGSRNPNPGPEPRSAGPPAPESIDGLSLRVPYPSGKPRTAFTATVTDVADKLIWTAQLPGSSGHIVPGAGGPVVITTAGGSGTALTARGFDAATGQPLWETDYGTLGLGGRYSQPSFVSIIATGDVVVGLTEATEPHSD